MVRVKTNIILALMLFAYSIHTQADIRLLNTVGDPVILPLVVGQEIQLTFESNLGDIGTPDSIKDKIHIQSIDSRMWIKATTEFKPVRLLVKDKDGRISIFLLSANLLSVGDKISDKTIQYNVVTQQLKTRKKTKPDTDSTRLSYVDLTRFVAQTLYAPKRLIKSIGIIRIPLHTKETINLFVCSYSAACNGNVVAKPIATWRSKYYYVTAINLVNQTKKTIILDPRDLLGNWQSATFQFNKLGSNGQPTDTSVAYLVSLLPFEQSLFNRGF